MIDPLPKAQGSIVSRFFNIFVAPSDVFAEVRDSEPNFWNWLMPVMTFATVGGAAILLVFTQPNVLQQVKELQAKAIQEKIAKGELPKEAAQKVEEFNEKMGSTIYRVFALLGMVVTAVLTPFIWGFYVWLLSKIIIKVPIPYMRAVEAAGTALPILLLGVIIGSLMTVAFGKLFCTPSLGLLIHDINISNKTHLAALAVNFIYLWMAVLMGIALATFTRASVARCMTAVLVLWLTTRVLCIVSGAGQMVI